MAGLTGNRERMTIKLAVFVLMLLMAICTEKVIGVAR
jgi:hypothetical protein